ncbi:MAG: FkbM family methyltransferase [Bacteroidetes bacterium]|nr:FkbM family methyltransferase [Bacteroidota bacterium]
MVKKVLRKVGLEVKLYNFLNAEEPLLKKLIKDFNIQTVIDVGANEGQYAESLLKNNYKGRIYSFEPISKPWEVLQKKAVRFTQWKPVNYAIGSKDETVSINVSENIVSSSIYKVAQKSLDAEPATRIIREEKIKVTTIDNFFVGENSLQGGVMLKLDVQGYELEGLKGALASLKKIKIVQVELSFVPIYEGAPLCVDVISFLQNQGFELFTLIPGFKDRSTGRLLQADGVFLR